MGPSAEDQAKQDLSEVEMLEIIKKLRHNVGDLIDYSQVIAESNGSREISLSITKLEEAKMWLGKDLGRHGETDLNAERDAK